MHNVSHNQEARISSGLGQDGHSDWNPVICKHGTRGPNKIRYRDGPTRHYTRLDNIGPRMRTTLSSRLYSLRPRFVSITRLVVRILHAFQNFSFITKELCANKTKQILLLGILVRKCFVSLDAVAKLVQEMKHTK